jgi:hypothetical protein
VNTVEVAALGGFPGDPLGDEFFSRDSHFNSLEGIPQWFARILPGNFTTERGGKTRIPANAGQFPPAI